MNSITNFTIHAIKTILLAPFYVIYFVFWMILACINYIISGIQFLCSHFKYGTKNENRYQAELSNIKIKEGEPQ